MIKPVCKDLSILSKSSTPATIFDLQTAKDLKDTLSFHKHECVGMAANMIGISKRIIVFDDNGTYTTMFNPEIISAEDEYSAQEGCLSLSGLRNTKRFYHIRVRFQDSNFKWNEKDYSDWSAQIIQHEIDHCNGILI